MRSWMSGAMTDVPPRSKKLALGSAFSVCRMLFQMRAMVGAMSPAPEPASAEPSLFRAHVPPVSMRRGPVSQNALRRGWGRRCGSICPCVTSSYCGWGVRKSRLCQPMSSGSRPMIPMSLPEARALCKRVKARVSVRASCAFSLPGPVFQSGSAKTRKVCGERRLACMAA